MAAAKADGREPQQRTRTTVYGVTEPSEYACGEMLKSNQLNAHHFDFDSVVYARVAPPRGFVLLKLQTAGERKLSRRPTN